MNPRIKTYLKRGALAGVGLLILVSVVLIGLGWRAFGRGAQGARLERMEKSAQWDGGGFENPEPLWNDVWGMVVESMNKRPIGSPEAPLPLVTPDPDLLAAPPMSGLRLTWFGHSSALLDIDGTRVLTDPVWGARASPFEFAGPQRWYAPLIDLKALPKLDAVVISHDHYDHLDMDSIDQLKGIVKTFIVPLGVGQHLAYWGVPEEHIVELDWWQSHKVGSLTITATPARHASGRQLLDQNDTLWASYALVGPEHRVYFSGDTGMTPAFKEIGERFGPFDVSMIEVGAYGAAWPDWHLGPEQAVRAHQLVRAKLMMPIHWGLLDMAYHNWTAPIERTATAAKKVGVKLLTPRPGQSVEPGVTATQAWWPEVPYEDAQVYPIRARGLPKGFEALPVP